MSRVRCAVAAIDRLQKEILFQPWPLTSVRIVTSLVRAVVGGATARAGSSQTNLSGHLKRSYRVRVAREPALVQHAAGLAKLKLAARADEHARSYLPTRGY